MFMKPLKIALIAALPILAAGTGMAASVTVMQQYPVHQPQMVTDHALADQLRHQGFQNVSLTRDGERINVEGTRKGEALTLVYDSAQGRLMQVNGQPALMQQTLDDEYAGHDR